MCWHLRGPIQLRSGGVCCVGCSMGVMGAHEVPRGGPAACSCLWAGHVWVWYWVMVLGAPTLVQDSLQGAHRDAHLRLASNMSPSGCTLAPSCEPYPTLSALWPLAA